jgi:glutathione S-transferase
MRALYHLWLSPACRQVRILLAEKSLDFELVIEREWERREGFLKLNPAGDVPVLVEADGHVIAGGAVICEYLDEAYPEPPMIGDGAIARAETRRLVAWFSGKFRNEVTAYILSEKFDKRFLGRGPPDTAAIRAGKQNIGYHLDYVTYLSERRRWLSGDDVSLADIAAAAQLSALDYLGDVPWDEYPAAREWYARFKSRPSVRPILADHIPGLPPPKAYADLDF